MNAASDELRHMDTRSAAQHLAAEVRRYRDRERLSMREFGSRAGLAVGTIQRLESGETPNLDTVIRAARVVRRPISTLLGEESGVLPPALRPLVDAAVHLAESDLALVIATASRLAEAQARATAAADPELERKRAAILDLPELDEDDRAMLRAAFEHEDELRAGGE